MRARRHADARIGVAAHALIGDGLDELADAEPARVARRTLGRQDVVGPGGLVAIGHRRLLAEEQRAVVGERAQPPVEIGGVHLEMLGGVAVAGLRRLLARLHEHHLAIVAPGGQRRGAVRLGQARGDLGHALQRGFGDAPRRRHQPGRRIRAVLGLADQVGRDDLGIRRVVGDDRRSRSDRRTGRCRRARTGCAWPPPRSGCRDRR